MKNLKDNQTTQIEYINKFGNAGVPTLAASVIIVTWNRANSLNKCIDSLQRQSGKDFEIIVVDNGSVDETEHICRQYDLLYVKLDKNYGLSEGRNIGVNHSRADVLVFLDDDAIADQKLVESHVRAHKENEIIALRGRSVPLNKRNPYNDLASHYDLGERIIPSLINLEGNSSFKKAPLLEVGGFKPELVIYGHEGSELTYRLIKRFGDPNKIIYYPDAVIYHNYIDNFWVLIKKSFGFGRYERRLEVDLPDFYEFFMSYKYPARKTTAKKKKQSLLTKLRFLLVQFSMWHSRKLGYKYQSLKSCSLPS